MEFDVYTLQYMSGPRHIADQMHTQYIPPRENQGSLTEHSVLSVHRRSDDIAIKI